MNASTPIGAPGAASVRPTATSALETSALRIAAMRFSRRLRAERAVDSMSDGQMAVLGWLKADGTHSLGELAERERVSPPSMNRTVNCLEESGYITRTTDVDDRRKVNITLTNAGLAVVAETVRRRDEWLEDALASLEPEERETLARAAVIMAKVAEG